MPITWSHKAKASRSAFWAAAFLLIGLSAAFYSTRLTALETGLTVTVTDQRGDLVEDAVLYLTKPDGASVAGDYPLPRSIDQQNTQFAPRVTVVPQGTSLYFNNSDSFAHHVYSFSAAKKLDVVVGSGTQSDAVTLDAPGFVALGCNIHDDMSGFIYVAPSKQIGKSDAQGRVTFGGLEDGDYILWAWHPRVPRLRTIEQKITVTGATTQNVKLRLRRPRQDRRSGSPTRRY